MPSVTDYSPLQYRPTDTHMGRWTWNYTQTKLPTLPYMLLTDQQTLPIASIHPDTANKWHIQFEELALDWIDKAPEKAADQARSALNVAGASLRQTSQNAERTAALLAIAAGEAPDPAHVPIFFMLGKTKSSQNYLKDLESLCREYLDPILHEPGSLAKLQGDTKNLPVNPVVQARALDKVFRLPKGHWPPRTDVFDDCIYLDSRYAPEYLERAARMGAFDENQLAERKD